MKPPSKFYFYFQKGKASTRNILLIILALLLLLLIFYIGFVSYTQLCGDTSIDQCLAENNKPSKTVENNHSVIAKGSLSYKKYSVTISMNIPLEGGIVSGEVVGDCKGKVNGTYSGGDGGAIIGKISANCTPFLVPIPVKATFNGIVNQKQKTVPINGTGKALGYSREGSLILTY